MNCKNCNTLNNAHASYCRNCGQPLKSKNTDNLQAKKGDTLLMVFIGIMVFNTLFSFIHNQFYPNWANSPLKNVQLALWGLMNLSYLLLPFVIKNNKLKVFAIVIVAIVSLYQLYQFLLPVFYY